MTAAQLFTARLLRRWAIVVAIAVIGGVAAAVWSVTNAVTTWTGTTALTTQSQNRSPDQDAVLALGYVDYFNQDTYQQLLRAQAAIPAGVTLKAMTGATSPVFYIEASGADEEQVRAAATAAAETYRVDIRTSLVAERQQAASDLQALIDEDVLLLQAAVRTDAERNVILDQIRSLQGRLTELQADSTNQIKQLQPVPGLASSTPSPAVDIAVGVVGGAVLGVLVVVLLMATDSRLRTGLDVGQRLGLRTFADFAGRGGPTSRALRMAHLANALDLVGVTGRATTVAIVSARRSERSSGLAQELAATVAQRGTESMLLLTDVRAVPDPALAGRAGLVEVLAGRAGLRATALRDATGYQVLPAGNGPSGESFTAFQPARLAELVAEAGASNRVVVIDAPPLLEAAESQLICAAADTVVIVVERGLTRLRDVREAIALLADVRVQVSGAVIDRPDDGGSAPAMVLEPAADTSGSNGSTEGAHQLVGPGSGTDPR